MDELAAMLFPENRNHQKVFLAIFIEIRDPKEQFIKAVCLVLIEHISRLNRKLEYWDGWGLSSKFSRSLAEVS